MSRQPSPGPSHPHSHTQTFHQILPQRQRSKGYATGIAAGAEDLKYQAKYKELKRKVKEIEADNDKLHFKVLQAKRGIQRMKIERAVLYERLSVLSPSPDVHDHQTLPPIHPRSGPPSLPVSHGQQHRDPREHVPAADPNDPAHMEYMRTHGNVRLIPGPDGRPIPPAETPMGPGVAPPPHGMPALHPSGRGSAPAHDSSRQLPPLPPLPPVQHFEPSRIHGHPHPHSLPSPHMHTHPTSSHDSARPTPSSSRSRSHLGPSQVGLPSHGQYPPDTLPSVQRVLQSPSLAGDRDRSRRHEVHELSSSHPDHHHSRHQDLLAQHPAHGQPADTRASSARILPHPHATAPATYRMDEHHDREFDKERDREWDRAHEIGRDREYNSVRDHSPPVSHHSRPVDRRGEYHDQPPRLREHDSYNMYSRSGTPGSGSGSGSGHGPGDSHVTSDSRPFYDDRGRYTLRPVNQPHEDAEFIHEDGRPKTQDRARGGGGGGGGDPSQHEHSRASLDSRKRSRGDMEVDGENEVGEASGSGNLTETSGTGFHPIEDRGPKRFHPESASTANPNLGVEDVES